MRNDAAIRQAIVERGGVYAALIELTYRCNFACEHCLVDGGRERDAREGPDLTTAELVALFDALARVGVLRLTLSGGEVTERRDLERLLREARRRGFLVDLKTNGSRLTAARVALLRELGITDVTVSVYSLDPGVHDAVTRRPGSLSRVLQGLERARAAGLDVRVALPVMRPNAHTVGLTTEGLRARGFPVSVTHLVLPNDTRDASLRGLNLDDDEARAFLAEHGPQAGRSPRPVRTLEHRVCYAGERSLAVSPTGDVKACAAMVSTFGNLRQRSLDDILCGEARRTFVTRRRGDIKGCAGCVLAPHCFHCPAAMERFGGDPFARTAFWCRRNARILKKAGGRRVGRDYVFEPAPPAPGDER